MSKSKIEQIAKVIATFNCSVEPSRNDFFMASSIFDNIVDKTEKKLDNALSELEAIRRHMAGEQLTYTTCISGDIVAGYGVLDGWIGAWEFQLPQWYMKAKGLG
jgi:hypothetical protein